ncbi:ADP-ribose pyrophosphatase [Owenweeksia hongkongensis DSM 17368]|uniref:ADP-ribose pyrophosphatase n=1 Tax=Owenweeksia hongkongensis (strain DSM 17368 / CIP 108786 / JCM 12287 / NRRL B-23963 / UST20020801) TaxID=926562 RepID=G8R371_OWEHD|nr:NUDIX domain-containing protein [Owenweeksia hongkongensis]AEV34096.1 ADP-ribose pyrophosphatase [Owenweeksia hongkongensis DSM 17368]
MTPTAFTIRIYGLLIHNNQLLLSRENILGEIFTKFPGGGLEFGEGIMDCLHREFREEVDISLSKAEHFYTSEIYVESAFHNPPKQVLCVYYLVETEEIDKIKIGNPKRTETLLKDEDQILYWCPLEKLKEQGIELPLDKLVIEKLLS